MHHFAPTVTHFRKCMFSTILCLCFELCHNFALFCFPSLYNVLPKTSLCCSFKVSNCPHVNSFCCCCIVFVYMCLSVPSTRRPHNPASIHHSPPTSHPSRTYCSIRHPRLRPHSHWQQRYSTTPRISTTPSACYSIFPLPSYFPLSCLTTAMTYMSIVINLFYFFTFRKLIRFSSL